MEIQFAFDPNSELQKKMDEIYKATGDLTIPLKLIAREWFKGNKSMFALRGPGRFADLSKKYKKKKLREYGFVYPILMASGRLMASITDPPGDESINRIEADKATLTLGTKVPYGVYHQSNLPRTIMPYRPFLLVGVEQIAPQDIKNNRVKAWMTTLDTYFQQVMDKK